MCSITFETFGMTYSAMVEPRWVDDVMLMSIAFATRVRQFAAQFHLPEV